MPPTLVSLESPFHAKSNIEYNQNLIYARKALRDSIDKGEAPFASHLLYPQAMNEGTERKHALELAQAWLLRAHKVVFYCDHGMSPGMKEAEELAKRYGLPCEYRFLEGKQNASD